MVDLSKFILNKKILSEVVTIGYKLSLWSNFVHKDILNFLAQIISDNQVMETRCTSFKIKPRLTLEVFKL